MKKRFCAFFFLLILLLFVFPVFSHETGENYNFENSGIYPITQLQAVYYGLAGFGILILLILLFQKRMDENTKTIVYLSVVAVIGIVTIYLIITTLNLNLISETKGPVHWHADYEIWVCDKEISLARAKGFSDKQGVDLMHSHEDNRIHVEGVLLDKKEASLGAFFYAVGGLLTDDEIKVLTDDGLVSGHNGDNCNGKPAQLYVFVNGNLTANPSDYVISPYEKVPPGDRIKFVFTEKSIQEIIPNLE